MKKTTFLVLPLLLIVTGCSTPQEKAETTDTTKQTETVVMETKETETEEISQEEREKIILTFLQQEMVSFDFSYDEVQKVYIAKPLDKESLLALAQIETNDVVADAWSEIAESFQAISSSIYNNLGSGYTINFVNPYAEDKTLLMVKDGQQIYNFTDDL